MWLTDSPQPRGQRNTASFEDPDGVLTMVDPTMTGATVSIGRVETGSVTVLDLPASGWSSPGNGPDYKFKSQTGPVQSARLKDGRALRFSAVGTGCMRLAGRRRARWA